MSGRYTEKEIKFYAVKYYDAGEMEKPIYSFEARLSDSDGEEVTIDSFGDFEGLVCYMCDIEF